MIRCATCGHDNAPGSTYCERCSSLLNAATSYSETARAQPQPNYERFNDYPNPNPNQAYAPTQRANYAPAQEYAPAPFGGYGYAAAAQPGYQITPLPRTRTVGGTIFSVVLYLWGLILGALGLAGGILNQAPNETVGLVIIGGGLLGIIILIAVLITHKRPRLRWWVRLLVELGVAVVGFLAVVLLVSLPKYSPSDPRPGDMALGSVFVIYGLVAAVLALW